MIKSAVLIALLVIISKGAYSQEETMLADHRFILKADVLLPVITIGSRSTFVFSATLEKQVKNRYSFQLTGLRNTELISQSYSTLYPGSIHHSATQIIPEFKVFLSEKKKHSGFYSGVYAKTIFSHYLREDYYPSSAVPAIGEYRQFYICEGLILGYQNYILKQIVVDVLVGFGIRETIRTVVIREEGGDEFYDLTSSHSDGRLALNVGYKF